MNEELSILSTIRSNPDDDTVRLVYADWLEERNRPERATFIRNQIKSSLRGEPDSQATRELFAAHWRAWFGHLTDDPSKFYGSVSTQYRHPSILGYRPLFDVAEQWTPNTSHATDFYCWWLVQRGFVSVFRGAYSHWLDFGAILCSDQPVTEVILNTIPTNDVSASFWQAKPNQLSIAEAEFRRQWPSVRTWTMTGDGSRFRTQKG